MTNNIFATKKVSKLQLQKTHKNLKKQGKYKTKIHDFKENDKNVFGTLLKFVNLRKKVIANPFIFKAQNFID